MEYITLSAKTGRPEFAAKAEAVIRALHQNLPDQVSTLPLLKAFVSAGCQRPPPVSASCQTDSIPARRNGKAPSKSMCTHACLTLQGLMPLSYSTKTGQATTDAISMGATGDSYYEYLLKVRFKIRVLGIPQRPLLFIAFTQKKACRCLATADPACSETCS